MLNLTHFLTHNIFGTICNIVDYKLITELEKKLQDFTFGKTKTINPISKLIQNCSNDDLNSLKGIILRQVKHYKKYPEDDLGYKWYCGAQIILHKFYELKPEVFDNDSIPSTSLEDMELGRNEWVNKKQKGGDILLSDLKDMLFFATVILFIIGFIIFLFTGPSDELKCYSINGEKVCKYESEWEKINKNFKDSVRNIPYDD